ncbi:hypothetical protein POF51_22465 [Brevibacillus sp. AG]|uniref:hypothetical protein n=1 Tax=Brevibacillus sp. AG TaxID=3020891 RepID=UPI00232DD45E|nr:hypothetical protein [Brevibacillus sp. AG]MDC0763493.1 hypothetical protein [Brevibacillus sp. AG]
MIIKKPIFMVERPKFEVILNGMPIKHEECSVELNAFDETDNFTVKALWNIGGTDVLSSNATTDTVLISKKDVPVQIKLNGKLLIDGIMDVPEWSFGMDGDLVTITGRGKIGRLIDRKILRNIKNRTASSLMLEIFAYHKLKPLVTATTKKVGTYSEDNQTSSVDMDDWELSNWLAEWEGFVVRVKGTEGFFGPLDQIPELKLPPIPFTHGSNCEVQSISRHQFGAREVIIEGRSYHGKRTIVEYYPRKPKKKDETAIIFRRTLTSLSQEQLRTRVRSIYQELTKYNISGNLTIPYFIEIDTDRRLSLYGVGKGLSQDYFCTNVKYSENADSFNTEIGFSSKFKEVEG